MSTISNEELIKAENYLLDGYRLSNTDNTKDIKLYEELLEKYEKQPEIFMESVFLSIERYNLSIDLESGVYIIVDNLDNLVEDSDFASGVYKWVARFGKLL